MITQNLKLFTGRAQDLYSNTSKWVGGEVYCAALKITYNFSAGDTFATVSSHIAGTGTRLYDTTVATVADGKVFDASDVVINVPENEVVGYLFLYYKSGASFVPLCLFSDVHGLPGTSLGGTMSVAFSAGASKLFRIKTSGYTLWSDTHLVIFNAVVTLNAAAFDSVIRGDYTTVEKTGPKTKRDMFTDISLTGRAHPLTGDLSIVTADYSINQSLRNILLTDPGTRPFYNIEFGGGLRSLLFEINDAITIHSVKRAIITSITNYEPRVTIRDVQITPEYDGNSVSIKIIYSIRMTNTTSSFDLFLERA